MLGIALGVAALIIVLSVMNGFQKEVRDRMPRRGLHIEVSPRRGAARHGAHAGRGARNPNVIGMRPSSPRQGRWRAART